MKLIDRYTFTNGKAFETWYLDANDTFLNKVPECDVIGLRSIDENGNQLRFTMMRPDEALIQARMLIDAVHKATSGYEIDLKQEQSTITIDGPPYFNDDETCTYCNRQPNTKHEAWCRQ